MKNILIALIVLWPGVMSGSSPAADNSNTVISGKVFFLNDGDSVRLHIQRFGSGIWMNEWDENLFCRIKNHEFRFVLPSFLSTKYVGISWMRPVPGVDRQMGGYPVSQGQEIAIDIRPDSTVISGNGSSEYLAVYKMNQVAMSALARHHLKEEVFDDVISRMRLADSIESVQEDILRSIKSTLSEEEIARTLGMIMTRREMSKLDELLLFYRNDGFQRRYKETTGSGIDQNPHDFFRPFFKEVDSTIGSKSDLYPSLVALKMQVDSSILVGRSLDLTSCYWIIENHYSGTLRDKILGKVLFNNRRYQQFPVDQDGFNFMASKAADEVKDSSTTRLIELVIKGAKSGEPAYAFQLKDSANNAWSLSNFRGKPLMIDFWFTGCGNCIRVIPYLKEMERKYSARGVAFVSVCIDHDKEKWLRSLRSKLYITENSINLFGELHNGKDDMVSFYGVSGCPFFLLIDAQGSVVGSMLDPRYDDGKEMERQLDRLLVKQGTTGASK